MKEEQMTSSIRCYGIKEVATWASMKSSSKLIERRYFKGNYLKKWEGISELPPTPFSSSFPGRTPAPLNHKLKPQMTNRFQTPCFNCQGTEFRFLNRACAVKSLPYTLPPRPSWRGGAAADLSTWAWGSPEYCSLAFPSTLNMTFRAGPKQQSSIRY